MTKAITTYRGEEPDAYRLTFSGAADNLDYDLGDGEDVVLIVRAKIKEPTWKTNQFGVRLLVEKAVVDHATVADTKTAARLMKEIKAAEDEAAGQTAMDADIDEGIDG